MSPAPDRSLAQRRDALAHANRVRSHRKQLKADLWAARRDPDEVLLSGDPLIATMRVTDILRSTPGVGPVKINNWLRRYGISPSKTVAGLSSRQQAALLVVLRAHRARSNTYAARKAAA